jgi:hypothetical protein
MLMRLAPLVYLSLLPVYLALFPIASQAQFGRGSWTTFGGDPQRTGWNRTENELCAGNVKDLKLEWSVKLDSQPRELTGPTVPLVRATMATPRGVKDLVVVAGAADKVFVIDGDNGKIYWQKTLSIEGTPERGDTWLCPNSLDATPAIGPAPRTGSGMGGQAVPGVTGGGRGVRLEALARPSEPWPPGRPAGHAELSRLRLDSGRQSAATAAEPAKNVRRLNCEITHCCSAWRGLGGWTCADECTGAAILLH